MKDRVTPWLDPIPLGLQAQAVEALDAGNVGAFFGFAGNEHGIPLVFMNAQMLRARGLYERALLIALVGPRINTRQWSMTTLCHLVQLTDRRKLLAAGDPLPGPGPFRIYRGVAGRGSARRCAGYHGRCLYGKPRGSRIAAPKLSDCPIRRCSG